VLLYRELASLNASKNARHTAQRPPGRAPAFDICLPPWCAVGSPVNILKDAYGGFWGTQKSLELSDSADSHQHEPDFSGCCQQSVALVQGRLRVCYERAPVLESETFGHGAVRIDGKGACHRGAAICCMVGDTSVPTIIGFVTSASAHGSGARRPCGVCMLDWKYAQPGQTVLVMNPYASTCCRQATLLTVP
jgi:hypothetical protein